jgi:hypothetical protein
MGRRSKSARYDPVVAGYDQMKRESREQFRVLDAGPNDLTAHKIVDRMAHIMIGDEILFDSMKEAFDSTQVDRHSSTIKAVGTVVEHHGGWLLVRLARGLTEPVNYFGIEAVNGKRWNWYQDPKTDATRKGRFQPSARSEWI